MAGNEDQEFLKHLFGLFRDEAADHLAVIEQSLDRLNGQVSQDEQAGLIEQTFRAVHNLKGAARSVDLRIIEEVCQTLEDMLAMMKRGSLALTQELIDLLDRASAHLGMLLEKAEPGDQAQSDTTDELINDILDAIPGSSKTRRRESKDTQQDVQPPTKRKSSRKTERGSTQKESRSKTDIERDNDSAVLSPIQHNVIKEEPRTDDLISIQDTSRDSSGIAHKKSNSIRVATQKLDELLEMAEDLVAIKLSTERIDDTVRNLVKELSAWEKKWNGIHASLPVQTLQEVFSDNKPSQSLTFERQKSVLDFIRWNSEFYKNHLRSVKDLAALTHQYAGDNAQRVDQLFDQVKMVTMLPISTLLQGFPRTTRELAQSQGKKVQFNVVGADTEIDRRILEAIKDPLLHAVRNAIDHGIETPDDRKIAGKPLEGSLTISISPQEGNKVEISITDDGRGIDTAEVLKSAHERAIVTQSDAKDMSEDEILGLVFRSGFSTRKEVSDISGRGLGLAIVRENAFELNGHTSIESKLGIGTTVRITLPLSLATFRGLLVTANGARFILPLSSVEKVLRIPTEEINRINNRHVIQYANSNLTFYPLSRLLGLGNDGEAQSGDVDNRYVVVVASAEARIALQVDSVGGVHEVLVKGLGPQLVKVRQVSGAAMLADGEVVPIIHLVRLIDDALNQSTPAFVESRSKQSDTKKQNKILVVDDSITSRTLLRGILLSADYHVVTAVDGVDALTAMRMDQFDLVVSDVDMPRMDGIELTQSIRKDEKLKKTPVLLVTSLDSKEDRERGLEAGADAYIAKASFNQNDLLDSVKRFL